MRSARRWMAVLALAGAVAAPSAAPAQTSAPMEFPPPGTRWIIRTTERTGGTYLATYTVLEPGALPGPARVPGLRRGRRAVLRARGPELVRHRGPREGAHRLHAAHRHVRVAARGRQDLDLDLPVPRQPAQLPLQQRDHLLARGRRGGGDRARGPLPGPAPRGREQRQPVDDVVRARDPDRGQGDPRAEGRPSLGTRRDLLRGRPPRRAGRRSLVRLRARGQRGRGAPGRGAARAGVLRERGEGLRGPRNAGRGRPDLHRGRAHRAPDRRHPAGPSRRAPRGRDPEDGAPHRCDSRRARQRLRLHRRPLPVGGLARRGPAVLPGGRPARVRLLHSAAPDLLVGGVRARARRGRLFPQGLRGGGPAGRRVGQAVRPVPGQPARLRLRPEPAQRPAQPRPRPHACWATPSASSATCRAPRPR